MVPHAWNLVVPQHGTPCLCTCVWKDGETRNKRKMNMSKWGRGPIFMHMSVLPGHSHLVYSATVFQLYFEKACPLQRHCITAVTNIFPFSCSKLSVSMFWRSCSSLSGPVKLSSVFSSFFFSFLFLFFPLILNYLWLYLFFLNISFLINFSFLSPHLSNILIYFPSLILVVSPHPLWLISWVQQGWGTESTQFFQAFLQVVPLPSHAWVTPSCWTFVVLLAAWGR